MNDKYDASEMSGFDDINLNTLEEELEQQLDTELDDLTFFEEEKEKIGNPDALGETVLNVVWEQFINQIAVTAGEDFIAENHGLHLDLRNDAHIQTSQNFAAGKIATHNYKSRTELEENYQRFKDTPHNKFRKKYVDPQADKVLPCAGKLKKNGIDTVKDIYTGRQISTQTKLANGKQNPLAAQREHVKPSAELYQDPSLQMAYGNKELAAIIDDPRNLQGYTSQKRNNNKSDKSPQEMDAKDKTKHWEEANETAENFINQKKKEGEENLRNKGKQTQKEEAFRISGKALRIAVMNLLAALIKEIIGKLILWFKSAERNLDSFIGYVKLAIRTFIGKLKGLLVNVADSVLTTIVASILGPVVGTIKKVLMLLKQGWASLKNAIVFLRAPENRGKPLSYLLPQVGIIVITGLTGIGAIALGEVIEKALMGIPFMAVDIPLLGSLANLVGMLMGAIVCGIIGAIAINMINAFVTNKQKNDNLDAQIDKKNEILQTQDKLLTVKSEALCETQRTAQQETAERHKGAGTQLRGILSSIVDPTISAAQDINNEQLDDLLQSF